VDLKSCEHRQDLSNILKNLTSGAATLADVDKLERHLVALEVSKKHYLKNIDLVEGSEVKVNLNLKDKALRRLQYANNLRHGSFSAYENMNTKKQLMNRHFIDTNVINFCNDYMTKNRNSDRSKGSLDSYRQQQEKNKLKKPFNTSSNTKDKRSKFPTPPTRKHPANNLSNKKKDERPSKSQTYLRNKLFDSKMGYSQSSIDNMKRMRIGEASMLVKNFVTSPINDVTEDESNLINTERDRTEFGLNYTAPFYNNYNSN